MGTMGMSLRMLLLWATKAPALEGRQPVELSRETLASHFPRGRDHHPALPPTYEHEFYVLHGANDLRPVGS